MVTGQGGDGTPGVIAGDFESVAVGIGAADELATNQGVRAAEIAEPNRFPRQISINELAAFAGDLVGAPSVGNVEGTADGGLSEITNIRTAPGKLNVLQIGAIATGKNQ